MESEGFGRSSESGLSRRARKWDRTKWERVGVGAAPSGSGAKPSCCSTVELAATFLLDSLGMRNGSVARVGCTGGAPVSRPPAHAHTHELMHARTNLCTHTPTHTRTRTRTRTHAHTRTQSVRPAQTVGHCASYSDCGQRSAAQARATRQESPAVRPTGGTRTPPSTPSTPSPRVPESRTIFSEYPNALPSPGK